MKTDDRLWKPGFVSWTPIHAIAELTKAAPQANAASPRSSQVAVVPEAPVLTPEPPSRAQRIKELALAELKSFVGIFVYLWIVFMVFLVHEWIVLASNGIGFRFYGLAAINALVLAKIMLIAEKLRFAERFEKGPLIYPILYKSGLFTVLLLLAYVVEEVLVGAIRGGGIVDSVPHIGGGTALGFIAVAVVMCVALMPFFAFREIGRAVGPAAFRSLIFGPAFSPFAFLRRREGAREAA